MTVWSRYAVYYAPPEGDPLADFGSSWLGWDAASGAARAHPVIDDLPAPVEEITATPRKYGFHGTLKPPFRLNGDPAALMDAVEALAAARPAFDAPLLRLARIGGFLALIPSAPSEDLAALASACVSDLDLFRAPPTEAELAKRRAAGLTPAQEDMLARWGYPYVGPEFRFHLTLSGALPSDIAARVEAALAPLVAPLVDRPMAVREVCLFGEDASDGRFRVIRRFPLA
ncbi:MAG: DUF1045 domain-containing protein [Pseudomonadota bacterium]